MNAQTSAAIKQLARSLADFRSGKISPEEFVKRRTRMGVYGIRSAADRYMLRIKVPGGQITGAGLRAIAEIVEEMIPKGLLHVTTRQDIEVHGLPEVRLIEVLQRLDRVDLTSLGTGGPGVRNIACCPMTGIAREQIFDVMPTTLALSRYFLGNALYEAFPKKVKISIESCATDHMGVTAADIGIQAAMDKNRLRGFRVWVGGGLGALPMRGQVLEEFIPEALLFPTVLGVLRVFHHHGDRKDHARARLKFLVQKMGIEKFRSMVRDARGGVPLSLEEFSHLALAPQREADALTCPIAPTGDQRMDRWLQANAKSQRQKDYCAVWVRCPLGDMTSPQAQGIASLAETFGRGIVRTAISQNMVIPWVRAQNVQEVYRRLDALGLATCCAGQVMDITRCVGGETCLSSVTASRSLALALEGLFQNGLGSQPALRNLSIKVSGCPNSCGHHHLADIGLFGSAKKSGSRVVPVYQILLGGKSRFGQTQFGRNIGTIPAVRCVQAVERIARCFLQSRLEKEDFSDFLDRTGTAPIVESISDLAQFPSYEQFPECYRDIGQADEFQLRARRGECSV